MSDPTPPDDELISSYIDGEATLDEVARIQADPELRARIQEFEAAKDLLSTPVTPLPEADVDRLIDNALWQSTTSDRITDLSAVRAMRTFSPQRLATIAATLVLLAGVVGALIALNPDSRDDMTASTADSAEMADDYARDDGDDMADDGDMVFDADMPADSDMADEGDDMAEAMPESAAMADDGDDMADEYFEDEGDDMATSDDSEQSVTEEQTESTTTATTVDPPRIHTLLNIETAESYESLGQLIDHTADRWRELVATDFAGFIVTEDEEGYESIEQALADTACGQSLLTHIYAMPDIDGAYTLRISETTITGIPISIAILPLTGDHPTDTAALLTASEPTCTVEHLTTLAP